MACFSRGGVYTHHFVNGKNQTGFLSCTEDSPMGGKLIDEGVDAGAV
jgi:hypothetical protein